MLAKKGTEMGIRAAEVIGGIILSVFHVERLQSSMSMAFIDKYLANAD